MSNLRERDIFATVVMTLMIIKPPQFQPVS